ncbi:MAG: hypothetical protein WAP51_02435 [Candidatus Sungiibacteriota bacterium]
MYNDFKLFYTTISTKEEADMRKFRALFKSIASNESMLVFAFRFRGIVKPAPDRKMKSTFWRTWEFSLTDEEIAAIKQGWKEPDTVPVKSDGATEAVAAYIRSEITLRDYELIRVDELTEPVPADATPVPRKHECSASCPLHRPGNPQLSDPWARGY